MSVHRLTPLPTGPSVGQLIVAESIIAPTLQALRQAHGQGRRPHEGLLCWLGRTVGPHTLVLAAAQPELISGPQRVHVTEASVGHVARLARRHQLGIVAQVHSHPGRDTRHSDGDDQLVLMPYDGMFSLVIGHYGHGDIHPARGAGLHQRQDDRWVQVTNPDAMLIVSTMLTPDTP
jgi:proteasome lid subunit RPN8/RPN11